MSDQPPYYQPPDQPQQQGYTYYPGAQPPPTTPASGYGSSNPYENNDPYSAYQTPGMVPPQSEEGGGQAIAGLVLGIVSIVLSWTPVIGLIAGVVGLILSLMGRKSFSRRTIAIVGLILSIIGGVFSLCGSGFWLLVLIGVASAPAS